LKILVLTPALDISKPFGALPWLWQLFKGFHEEGHELLIIPFHGQAISSIWWRCFPNPNYYKGIFMEKILGMTKHTPGKKNLPLIPYLSRTFVKPKLKNLINKILNDEKEIDAIFVINLPMNQINGLFHEIVKNQKIPVVYYDLDAPSSLPKHGGFTFNHYVGADLSDYDSIIIASEGSVDDIKSLGAQNVDVVHFGVDMDVYTPISLQKDIDFFFFGNGGKAREKNMKMMISEPSNSLTEKFIVSGNNLNLNMGKAKVLPPITFTQMRKYCCRAKVNLNVVRELHAKVFATSTSRPFELGAMKCCIVSAPYTGLEKWFDTKKEILITNSAKESIEIYQMLLDNEELRTKMGLLAYERVKKEHTARHRVKQIIEIIQKFT